MSRPQTAATAAAPQAIPEEPFGFKKFFGFAQVLANSSSGFPALTYYRSVESSYYLLCDAVR